MSEEEPQQGAFEDDDVDDDSDADGVDGDFKVDDMHDDSDDDVFLFEAAASDPIWSKQQPLQYLLGRSRKNGRTSAKAVYGEPLTLERDAEGPRIRLLRIRPGARGEPIYGDLLVRPLFEGQIHYVALSYAWGKQVASRTIYLGPEELEFHLSPHLHAALDHLRHHKEYTYVWVDAICINQENDLERSAQIQIMAQIYHQANEVRVWLGVDGFANVADNDDDLMWALCQRESPWWRRLWVVQECAYSKKCPVVMFGQKQSSLQDLVERWTNVVQRQQGNGHSYQLSTLQYNLVFVEQLYAAWIEQSMTGRLPLLIRLRQTARHQYSVAHDRNFAILSLVNEEEVKKIKPDYRQPYSSLRSTVGVLLQRSVGWNADRDKYLLANPKDSRTINEEFRQASHNGDCPTILHFMVSETMMDTQRGLRAAVLQGHLDVVRLLLERGARIHADRSSDHDTALFGACTNGHVAIVKLLIERGALADVPGSRLSTALSAALANDHIDVAKLLLEHGVDADGTELNVASARGRIDLAELLLNNGADVNAYGNGYGTEGFTNGTALHVASARGFYDLAGLLLERGANANANIRVSAPGYERGLTPLWHAASNGDIATMRLLHARGGVLPDSYGPNDDGKYTTSAQGRMLLLKKAARNNQASVLELLLTEEGIEEPLAVALKYGSTSVVELLLTKLGIDGNMLQYAAGNDRSERPCRRHRAPTELKGHRYRYLGIQPYHLAVVESTNLHKISTEERGVDRKAVEASISLGVSRSMGVASSMAIKTSDTAEAELGPILLTENRHGKPIIARTPPGVVTVNEILL